METKKAFKVNLEKKRFLFLELGLVLALGITFAAFEWSSPEIKDSSLGSTGHIVSIEDDVISIKPQTPPPPPTPPTPTVIAEVLVITDIPTDNVTDVFAEPTGPVIPIIVKPYEPVIEDDPVEIIPFVKVEVKPAFPGGDAALLQFISKNTSYPKIPLEMNIEGKVYVQFVIGTDGHVSSVSIAKGVDYYLDLEAIRVVSALPPWTPGSQRGKKVPVSYIIPINFNIE